MWLIFGTVAYIKESGDFSILDEPVPFDNKEGSEVSLFEHLRVSFNHVIENLGPHMLPLIGRADWNDCLNLNCFSWDPNESFQTTENQTEGSQAESLMIAGLFVVCGRDYVELCRRLGKDDEANRAQTYIDNMVEAVKKHGWDGDWYLRAYDYFGHKVGSKENEEGQIFIESQGWCTMAGIGLEEGMVKKSAGLRKGTPGLRARYCTQQSTLHPLCCGVWRNLHLSRRLQGERRYLLPQTTRGSSSEKPYWDGVTVPGSISARYARRTPKSTVPCIK